MDRDPLGAFVNEVLGVEQLEARVLAHARLLWEEYAARNREYGFKHLPFEHWVGAGWYIRAALANPIPHTTEPKEQ